MLQLEGITLKELEQIVEMVKFKPFLECKDDPKLFMERFVKVQHPTKGAVPFQLYDFQHDMLNVIHENKNSIHLTARQMGCSYLSSAYLVWYAIFHPGHSTVSVHPNKVMAEDFLERIKYILKNIDEKFRPHILRETRTGLTLDNGATITVFAASRNAGRGMGISLLHLADFGDVPDHLQHEMWMSLYPVVQTGGKCFITGCSGTTNGIFYLLWDGAHAREGRAPFTPFKATWEEHPDRDEEWKHEMTHFIGVTAFQKEFECAFVTEEDSE